jgi:hypothetical protein
MTAADVLFGLALGIGAATATAFAYLAAPLVRDARARFRRIR